MQDIFKPSYVFALEQYELQRGNIDPGVKYPEPRLISSNSNPQPEEQGGGKKVPPLFYLGGE